MLNSQSSPDGGPTSQVAEPVPRPSSASSVREAVGASNRWRRYAVDLGRIAAPKSERALLGGCLLIFWLISAASMSGYIILALFLLVGIGRLASHGIATVVATLPKRSQVRHCIALWMSVVFFALLTARACYFAAVVVDTKFRSDPPQAGSGGGQK